MFIICLDKKKVNFPNCLTIHFNKKCVTSPQCKARCVTQDKPKAQQDNNI